jgi:hypothetical protein
VISCLRPLGNRYLCVGMEGPVAGGWRDYYRAVICHAENFRGHVDRADIDQPTRTQLELQEALAINAERYFIVYTGDQVAKMRRRQVLLRDRFEIEHVEGVHWGRKSVCPVRAAPRP